MAQSEDGLPQSAVDDDLDLDDAELLAEAAENLEVEEETPLRPEEAERLGDLDALGTYLREIGRYPLLTAAQEVELAKRIENGTKAEKKLQKGESMTPTKRRQLEALRRDGAAAKHDMVQANLRLVVSIARRYRATGIPLLDLVQEGNIGLMRAVDKFEWRKGFDLRNVVDPPGDPARDRRPRARDPAAGPRARAAGSRPARAQRAGGTARS